MKREILLLIIFLFLLYIGCTKHNTNPLSDGILQKATFYNDYIVAGEEWIFEDFNSGAGSWKTFDDSPNGGNSTATFSILSKSSSDYYMHCEYTLGPNFSDRYAGVQITGLDIDISKYKGIMFELRGSGHMFRINVRTANIIGDWDFYGYTINSTTSNWKLYIIPFSEFERSGFGAPSLSFDLEHFEGIELKSESRISGEQGWFDSDNIKFVEYIVSRD